MSLERHIRELELRLLLPEVRASAAALGELLSDDFTEHTASGNILARKEILDRLPSENGITYTVSAFKLRELGPEVVLATYHTLESGSGGERRSIRSSTWVRRDGHWLMAFHQGTPLDQTK
jgi:hypothetical protein